MEIIMRIQLSGKKLIKFLYTHQSTKQFESTIQRLKNHNQEKKFSIDDIYVFLLLYVPKILEKNNSDSTSIEKQFLSILKKSPDITERNFHIPANIPFLKMERKKIVSYRNKKPLIIIDEFGYYFPTTLKTLASTFQSQRKSSKSMMTVINNANVKLFIPEDKNKTLNLKSIFKISQNFRRMPYYSPKPHRIFKRVAKLSNISNSFKFPENSHTKLHKILPFKSSMTNRMFLNKIQSIGDVLNYQEVINSYTYKKEKISFLEQIPHLLRLIKRLSSKKDYPLLINLIHKKQSQIQHHFKQICCDSKLISWIYKHDRQLFPNLSESDSLDWINNMLNINENLTDNEITNLIFPRQEISSNYKSIYQHIKGLKFSDLFFNINNFNYLEESNISYYERLKKTHAFLGLNYMQTMHDNDPEQYIHLDPIDILLRNHHFNYLVNDELFIMSLLCTYEPKILTSNLTKEKILNTVFNFLDNMDVHLSNCSQFIYSDLMTDIIKSGYWNPTKKQLLIIKDKLNIFNNNSETIKTIKNNPSLTEKTMIVDTLLLQAELEEFTPIKPKATSVNKY